MLKGKLSVVIAAGLALAAAILANRAIEHERSRASEGWTPVPVLVARQDLSAGSVVSYDCVARSSLPEQYATPSVLTPEQFDKVAGQRLHSPVQRGDLLMWNHFRADDGLEQLSSIISRPTRAISLTFPGDRGVAGWVRPSDHVDILGTFLDPKNHQMVTITLLENVVVLATDQDRAQAGVSLAKGGRNDYSSVTLMVLPEEAEMLTLASEMGSLRLTLRNPESIGTLDQRTRTTLDYLLTREHRKEVDERRKKLVPVLYPSRGGGAGLR